MATVAERRPVTTPLPVRVVFTKAGVEADDDIIDAVAATDASQPVAVLSADRRVRDGASVYGANLLSPDDLRTVLADGG
jgi:predicted RNA-binding protein with PIN domain